MEIKRLLGLVRRAEPGTPQKLLRDKLRAIGFYISDFAGGPAGFTASEFDELVRAGLVSITDPGDAHDECRGGTSRAVTPAAPRRRAAPRPAAPTAAVSPPMPPVPTTVNVDGVSAAAASGMAALAAEPLSFEAAVAGGVPDCPGLYALYGSPETWRALGLGAQPDGRPLYVGKAEASLVSRDLKTHFATGKTGQSSPRRSFAALLATSGALELVAVPRRAHDPEPTKSTHYSLAAPGDEQLTTWMRRQLRITVWPASPDTHLGSVEGEVMNVWLPPLNLIGVRTQWTSAVKAARATMATQARNWARERGFDV
jgi:hypothetical protein